jgi:hypothetical protein
MQKKVQYYFPLGNISFSLSGMMQRSLGVDCLMGGTGRVEALSGAMVVATVGLAGLC